MPALIQQLKQPTYLMIRETIIWALGNLASDNNDYR